MTAKNKKKITHNTFEPKTQSRIEKRFSLVDSKDFWGEDKLGNSMENWKVEKTWTDIGNPQAFPDAFDFSAKPEV